MPTQFKLATFAGGLCMNSAALRLIPKHQLEVYGEFTSLFQ